VISIGVSDISCDLAILIDIELKFVRKREQQRFSIPHAPKPEIAFATSRGPI
jgi:hypothetical protein